MNLKTVTNGFYAFREFIDDVEEVAIDLVAKTAPWAGPLPTAYLVFDRTQVHLSWPFPIALVAAIALEAIGLSATATLLTLMSYNRNRKKYPATYTKEQIAKSRMKVHPEAPTLGIGATVILYVVMALYLTVVLDVASNWPDVSIVDLSPIAFPFLSLISVYILSTRMNHRERLRIVNEIESPPKQEKKVVKKSKSINNAPDFARDWVCWCGWHPDNPENIRNQVGGHAKRHYNEVADFESADEALEFLVNKYKKDHCDDGPAWPSLAEITRMMRRVT